MVKTVLTTRQQEILDFIVEYWKEGGSSPTYKDIQEHFGFRSVTAVQDHCSALARKGYVELTQRGVVPDGLKAHIQCFFASSQ